MKDDKNSRAARRRDNAIAVGSIAAGAGVGAAGYGAVRASRAVRSGVDDIKRTTKTVRDVAGAPARGMAKIGKLFGRIRKKIRLEAHIAEITEFGATEVEKGTMRVDGILISVPKLERILAGRKVVEIPLRDVKGIERTKGLSKERLRNVAHKLDKPGIITTDGTLIDGRHRCRMRRASGETTGLFRKATKKDLKAAAVEKELSARIPTTDFARPYRSLSVGRYPGQPVRPGSMRGAWVKHIDGHGNPIPARGSQEAKDAAKRVRIYKNDPIGKEVETAKKKIKKDPDLAMQAAYKDTPGLMWKNKFGVETYKKRERGIKDAIDEANRNRARGKNVRAYANWNGSPVIEELRARYRRVHNLAQKETREERWARIYNTGDDLIKAGSAGGFAGYGVAGVPGAIVGGGASVAGQLKMSRVATKKEENRKPIQGSAARNIIPAAMAGVGAGLATDKGQKIMKKTKAYSRLLRKRLKNLEARLDDVIDFARRDQPRDGAGEFIGHRGVLYGTESSNVLNPHYRANSVDPGTREKLIPDSRKPFQIPEVRSGVIRDAQKYNKWGGRVVRTGKDAIDVVRGKPREKDSAGRPKKREWEKSYFKNAVATGATAAGIFIGARKIRNSPSLQGKIRRGAGKGKEMLRKAVDWGSDHLLEEIRPGMIEFGRGDRVNKVVDHMISVRGASKTNREHLENVAGWAREHAIANTGVSKKLKNRWKEVGKAASRRADGKPTPNRKTNMAALEPGMINFSTASVPVRDARGREVFRVEDVRGNSARIHTGDKPKRERRKKYWHERAENERKLWGAGMIAAGAGGVAIGAKHREIGKAVSESKLYQGAKNSKAGQKVGQAVASRLSPKAKLARSLAKAAKAGTLGRS